MMRTKLPEWVQQVRAEIPFLVRHPEFVYLDNAATTLKPAVVSEVQAEFLADSGANPLRGVYAPAVMATESYRQARESVARFFGASPSELIFTRGTTESINLLAYSLKQMVGKGDEIVISALEHHSNFLPWRRLAREQGASLRWAELDGDQLLSLDSLMRVLSSRTKIVALTGLSNVTGQMPDIAKFAKAAHSSGAMCIIDGAQLLPHSPFNFGQTDIDAIVFSGHKLYGPFGIGGILIKSDWREALWPYQLGGEMVETVTRERTTWAEGPQKFEAGTVNITGSLGLAAALEWLAEIGWERITARERELTMFLGTKLLEVPGVTLVGSSDLTHHHGLIAWNLEGVHPHDVATIVANDSIGVRAGHHCAAPLHQSLGLAGSVRASVAFYNTYEEIERLVQVVAGVRRKMGL